MKDHQFLELLKRSLSEYYFPDNSGKCKSTLEALELIETFKKQIQNETINDFITIYKDFVPDQDARYITADKLSRKYENSK